MTTLELQIVGDRSGEFDLHPTEAVFAMLVGELGHEGQVPAGVINVALVDDEHVRWLNRDQAGHDYATDVLSFSYIEDGGEPIDGVIGEMVVSVEAAERQAQAAETNLAEEVALLVLHGTLHILGWDHQTPEQQDRMQQLQRKLITAAGYRYREFVWQD